MRIGSFNPELTEATEFTTALGNTLLIEPLQRTRDRVHLADGFSPCFVLLNNDLSGGVPEILQNSCPNRAAAAARRLDDTPQNAPFCRI